MRAKGNVRAGALLLLGIGLATSAWAVPMDVVDLSQPSAAHGLLATLGLVGLAFGGRSRSGDESEPR